jgi:hypothetical protein
MKYCIAFEKKSKWKEYWTIFIFYGKKSIHIYKISKLRIRWYDEQNTEYFLERNYEPDWEFGLNTK